MGSGDYLTRSSERCIGACRCSAGSRRGRRELLRPRIARPKFHDPRRLRLRKDSGLCPRSGFGPRTYSDETNELLGRPCPPRRPTDRASPRAGLCRAPDVLREAVAASDQAGAVGRHCLRRACDLPLEPCRRCTPLPAASLAGSDVLEPDRRGRDHRLDFVHVAANVPGGRQPYWRVRADAETVESTEALG